MRLTRPLSLALTLATASLASASVIQFDPDGPGAAFSPVAVGSFDFLPGNLLLSIYGSDSSSASATLYYQARLGALLDPAGHPIPLPGLNGPAGNPGSFEITAVFGLDVDLSGVGYGGGPGGIPLLTFQLASTPSPSNPSYFSLYFDHAPDAADLAGTGFRNGSKILAGADPMAFGNLSFVGPSGASLPLDSFNPANLPGVLGTVATGSLKLFADADSADTTFFTGDTNFALFTDTTLASPYFHTDPSQTFDIGPDGSTIPYAPALDPTGNLADDMVFESDAATGFLPVPEPTSLSLLTLAALALPARRRRRHA